MTCFMYVMQPGDMPLWKMGHTANPAARLQTMQGQSPHQLRYLRIIMVESRHHAAVFERYALSWLRPHRSHGEWITSLDAINAEMDAIAPAVDATDWFNLSYSGSTQFPQPYSIERYEDCLREADRRQEWDRRRVELHSKSLSAGVSSDVSQLDVLAEDQRGGASATDQGAR